VRDWRCGTRTGSECLCRLISGLPVMGSGHPSQEEPQTSKVDSGLKMVQTVPPQPAIIRFEYGFIVGY
jgi:hypothetical protein